MAIISCPECGKQISDRAVACPDCGCPINAAPAVATPVDASKEIEKLIVLARRAREASDSKNAKKYYDQILDKDPGNWEAMFYSVYFEAAECKIMYIASAANSVANCIYSTFSAIADLEDEDEQDDALDTVIFSARSIAIMLVSGAENHYNQFSTTDNAFSECVNRVVAAGNIYGEIEASLKKVFPGKKERLVQHQKIYVDFLKGRSRWYNNDFLNRTYNRIDGEIAAIYPEHRKKIELEKKIAALNTEINGLKTERKAAAGCVGYFFLPIGIIMLVLGLALMSMSGDSWPILVAIPELIIGALCLRKTPSEEEVAANKIKKEELIAQRDNLQKEMNALKY